jgi:hypothetical protein
MPAGNKIHTSAIAKHSRSVIYRATPGRRKAFAMGTFGDFVVMLAKPGSPGTAVAALSALKLPENAPKNALTHSFKPVGSGLLYRNGKTIVLQCRKKPTRSQIRKVRGYFSLMNARITWGKVQIDRLGEGDEGDPEDALAMEDLDNSDIDEGYESGSEDEGYGSDADDEVEIVDNWEDEPLADLSPGMATMDATPAAEPDDGPEVDPMRAEKVERVSGMLSQLAPRLKLMVPGSDGALRQVLGDLVDSGMPLERLLLSLCYTPNIEHVASMARKAGVDGQADPADDTIANDETGHGKVAQAAAALGKRVAGARALVGAGEEANPDTHLRAMIKKHWETRPQLTSEQLILELIEVLGSMFETADPKRLRGMLGLSPKMSGGSENWREDIARLRAAWEQGVSGVMDGVAQIKDAIREEFHDQDDGQSEVAGAMGMLDEVTARLRSGLVDALSGLEDAEGAQLSALSGNAAVQLAGMRSFLQNDGIATKLDGNEFAPGTQIVGPLFAHLDGLQTILAQINTASVH